MTRKRVKQVLESEGIHLFGKKGPYTGEVNYGNLDV